MRRNSPLQFRIHRQLRLIALAVTLIGLSVWFLAPTLVGSHSKSLATGLLLSETLLCAFLWRSWGKATDDLGEVQMELATVQSIVEVSRDAIIGVTGDGIIMSWNEGARSIYGYSMKEALGTHISALFDYERTHEAVMLFEKVSLGKNVEQYHTIHMRKEKRPIDVSLTICPIRAGEKRIIGASVVARDITQQQRAGESQAQQAAAMKASMDGMAIIDHHGACVYLNDAYAKIYGYSDPESLVGVSWESFYLEDELRRMKNLIMPDVWRDGSWRGEVVGRRLDGGTFPLEISISSVAGGGLVQVVRDITERKDAEDKLRSVSLKDELSGLFNRRGLLQNAAPYFEFARRQKEKLFILFIDLDGMKQINDEFGHSEGDNALLNTAALLRSSFRDTDIIARIGGDEFTVVATDSSANSEEAVTRLKENLEAYNARKEHSYTLAFSIGVATLEPERMTCFEQLLEKADRAMYEQKRITKRRGSDGSKKKQELKSGLVTKCETGPKSLVQLQDKSDRKTVEEMLTLDSLTGLPNRVRLIELLRLRVDRMQHTNEQPFAVLFLDVDRLKLVIAGLGTSSGDALLRQIANRIKAGLRQGDIVGRVGGDEFVVLLNNVAGEDEACLAATRIQQKLAISFNLLGEEIYAAMSIGISLSSGYSEQVSDMLRDAETAMHRARLGKSRYEIFDRDMRGELMNSVKMEPGLHSIDREQSHGISASPVAGYSP